MPRTDTLILPEASARSLLLVQAIETVDASGRLVSDVERERIDRDALQATGDPGRGQPLDEVAYLQDRAQRILAAVGERQPRVLSVGHPSRWIAWLPGLLPILAFGAGATLERIGNPQQVNLLSPPLLAFVFWNLVVYLALVAGWVWSLPAGRRARGSAPAVLDRFWAGSAQRRTGHLRADIAAQFRWRWLRAAGALEVFRWQAVLHSAAAAWALGVAMAIVLGGLVREYRVGWESTLLDLPQVHAFLSTLFAPVVALLPLEAFSLADLERMHFRSGVEVGRAEARRWIGLYLGLLAIVVVVPRLLLAALASWRRRRAGNRVPVDLQQDYFQQVLGRVSPADVLLCLLPGPPHATTALHSMLCGLAERWPRGPDGPVAVLATARGDELRWMELPGNATPPPPAPPASGWRSAWLRWSPGAVADAGPAAQAQRHADVVLCPVAGAADLGSAADVLRWIGRPVLVLAAGPALDASSAAELRADVQRLGPKAELLDLETGLASWRHERVLREALLRLMPAHKAPGMQRIVQAWEARHEARLAESMRILAEELLQAARDTQAVQTGALDLRRLVRPADREVDAQARQDAAHALEQRLRDRHAVSTAELLRLHAVEAVPLSTAARNAAPAQLQLRQQVDSPQAGLAGAASGAALGASVDLMVGGITLGAAAALGAVVGGGAALAAAAWKNRGSPGTGTLVQPGDAVLEMMTSDALLRYLAVVHAGRVAAEQGADLVAHWQGAVAQAAREARAELNALWTQARAAQAGPLPVAALAQRLTRMVLTVLDSEDGAHGPSAT